LRDKVRGDAIRNAVRFGVEDHKWFSGAKDTVRLDEGVGLIRDADCPADMWPSVAQDELVGFGQELMLVHI
jgi:hypothetical protein